MAEAVKNNGRKRRPPSHLRQGYNQDNFEPSNTQYLGSREPYRQGPDPCSTAVLAKLLTKFMNSSNKKFLEAQTRKAEQQVSPPPAKAPIQTPKYSNKPEKIAKQQRQSASSKILQNPGVRQTGHRQESAKYQQRLPRYSSIPSSPHPINQFKQTKNQSQAAESAMKSTLMSGTKPNFDSLNKMSRDQFLKMMPKGYDPNLWREQLLSNSDFQTSKIFGKLSENLIKPSLQNTGANQFRQGTKLFKRASFHVGIAYNIHIENIRHKNPNFSPEELDPTYVSRKLKQQNSDNIKKQNQQNERLRAQQQLLFKQKQQQIWEATMMRQRQQQFLTQLNIQQKTPNKKQNSVNEPICIDDQDQSHKIQVQQIENKISPQISQKLDAEEIPLKQQINPEAISTNKENGQMHQEPKQMQPDVSQTQNQIKVSQTPKANESSLEEKNNEQI